MSLQERSRESTALLRRVFVLPQYPCQTRTRQRQRKCSSSITQTDAEGNYRLVNITPGPYYVMAGLVDRPTYFPGTSAPGPNSVIRVTATATATDIDFRLTQSPGLKVSGRIEGLKYAAGNPLIASSRVTLLPRTPPLTGMLSVNVKPTDFTFEFVNVPPGTYSVQFRPWDLRAQGEHDHRPGR